MTQNFIENARKLSDILQELLSTEKDEENCSTAVYEMIIPNENDDSENTETFQITFVHGNTTHPLPHIASSSSKGYFLVGKAVIDSVYNEDGDEELQVSVVHLSREAFERVLVGTPLSQDVVFVNGSAPLHKGSSTSTGSRFVASKIQSCVQEWRLNNALAIHPVEIGKARYLVSIFDHCLANVMTVETPFWVVADESNTGKITHIAALPQSDKVVNHVVVNCNGPFVKADALPSLNSMKKLHNQRCIGTIVENSSSAYALYDLLGVSNATDQENLKSSAYVEFTWKDVTSLLQPPPLTSDCVLHVKCLPGSMQLTEFSLSSEVNRLKCFIAMISNPDQDWPDPCSEHFQELAGQMEKVLETLSSGEGFSQIIPDEDNARGSVSSAPPTLSDQEFAPRKDLDFTESLWLVLKDALHFDDLIASLKIAMNALLNGFCQVVIHPSNKTHLAMFIRQLLQCETSEQRHELRLKVERMFDDEAALKCLVGIGCEKLLRDHTNYFLSEELVTQDQLKYYMNTNIPLAEKVERVSKLQNVLELIVTTKCILNTGHANLQLLTQSALMYYESHSSDNHPVFSLPLPAYGSSSISAVKTIVSNEQPAVWCLALKTKSKKNVTTSVIELSTESPLHSMPDFNQNDSKQDLTLSLDSKMPYYLSYAKQSTATLVATQ